MINVALLFHPGIYVLKESPTDYNAFDTGEDAQYTDTYIGAVITWAVWKGTNIKLPSIL